MSDTTESNIELEPEDFIRSLTSEDVIDPADFKGRTNRELSKLMKNVSNPQQNNILSTLQQRMQNEDWSLNTLRNHTRQLRILANNTDEPLIEQDAGSLNTYLANLTTKRNWAQGTKRNYAVSLSIHLESHNRAETADNIDIPSINSKDDINEEDVLSTAEIRELVEAAQRSRDKAIIAVGWESGCRVTALASLNIGDIEERRQDVYRIQLPDDAVGLKGAQNNIKPVAWSVSYLDDWLESHPNQGNDDDETPLFCSLRSRDIGKRLRPHSIYKIINKVAEQTDIDNSRIKSHALKHSRASFIKSNPTFDKTDAETYLDWTDGTQMHEVYEHLTPEEEANRIEQRMGFEPVDEDSEQQYVKCPNCGYRNLPESTNCGQCTHRLTSENPRWFQLYRKVVTDDDELVEFYENDIPPAFPQLPPNTYRKVGKTLALASIADSGPYANREDEEITTSIDRKKALDALSEDDIRYIRNELITDETIESHHSNFEVEYLEDD